MSDAPGQAGELRPFQAPGLEISDVADGLVVYEDASERVHYLNNTAAVVFELCTGENTEGEIASLLGNAFDRATAPEAEVQRCLSHLREQGIIR